MQVPDREPASHTRSPTPRSRAAAGSPLVVHSGPTAVPSAVDIQRLAWVGGGGWGGAPSVDGRTPWGGVLPAHNGHAARSGADAGPTTASGRNQLRPGYGRPRSRKTGWAGTGPGTGPGASRPWQRLCARPRRGAAHTGGWVNPLSGCAHRGRVALARQLSPRPVACCCPQRLAPLCATDTRHACGTFQLTHGAPRPT